jgi:hypothetical protein
MTVMEKSQLMTMRLLVCEKEVTNQFALPNPKAVNLDPLA